MNANRLASWILRNVLGNALDELNDAGAGHYILQWAGGDFPDKELADLAAEFSTEYPLLIGRLLDSELQETVLEYAQQRCGYQLNDDGGQLEDWLVTDDEQCIKDCVAVIDATAVLAEHVAKAYGRGSREWRALWDGAWETCCIYAYGRHHE